MDDLQKLARNLMKHCVDPLVESADSVNLTLTKDEFADKILKEENGQALLDLLEFGEFRVVERMGFCHGYIENGEVYFDVPQWNALVAHLQIVNSV